jgi:hypothetical protein
MRATRIVARATAVALAVWWCAAGTAAADNCSNPADCYATDSAATRAGLALLALLLLHLLLHLLGWGGGAGSGWGWPGSSGGEGQGGPGDGGAGGVATSGGGSGLTDRLLGLLKGAFGFDDDDWNFGLSLAKEGTLLGGRTGGTATLLDGQLLGADGKLTVTGEGIAELTGKAGLTLGTEGLVGELGLGATIGARAELMGQLQSGWITQTLKGELFTGATAEGTGKLSLTGEGLAGHGEFEAFVGGKATGSYELATGPVTSTVGGSVSYGLGYKAEGDVSFGWDKIGFTGKGGATIGLGGEGTVGVEISPSQIVDGIGDAVDYFSDLW